MQCIITGFDPFDNAENNPSQQAVGRLEDVLTLGNGAEIQIKKLTLPTCCEDAFDALSKAVHEIPHGESFAIVMSGLAETRERISLEWFAVNMRHYRIADNQAHQWSLEKISTRGAEALTSSVELGELVERLREHGLQAEITFHAGTFVCNETYYRALEAWATSKHCAGVVFIHFPSVANYQKLVSQLAVTGEAPPRDRRVSALEDYAETLALTAKFVWERNPSLIPPAHHSETSEV